jgi:hypothetical protein
MDDSLKNLEAQLENLVPRALSNSGRERCHDVIDDLSEARAASRAESPIGLSWSRGALAASLALGLGLGGGWYLGKDNTAPMVTDLSQIEATIAGDFDQLDHETWMLSSEPPGVYVSKAGEVREVLQETEITKEVVKHRASGHVVTVETTDHHLIDSVKTDF